ncbi:MAG: DUF4199 domain-containing protein [Bacteroidota bacterium]
MENADVNQKPGMFKPALNYAVIVSAVLIVITLLFYLFGNLQSDWASWTGFAVFLAGVVYSVISFRNEKSGGYISYGNVVGFSTLLGLFTGVITGLFAFILYGFIAPDLMDQLRKETITATESLMLQTNPNISNSELDSMIDMQLRFLTPPMMMVRAIFGYLIQGVIIGLIAGIFVKKSNPDETA